MTPEDSAFAGEAVVAGDGAANASTDRRSAVRELSGTGEAPCGGEEKASPKRSTSAVAAVTVVVVGAEAEEVAISAVVGRGVVSDANGSEIGASEGTEESAAKESVSPQ